MSCKEFFFGAIISIRTVFSTISPSVAAIILLVYCLIKKIRQQFFYCIVCQRTTVRHTTINEIHQILRHYFHKSRNRNLFTCYRTGYCTFHCHTFIRSRKIICCITFPYNCSIHNTIILGLYLNLLRQCRYCSYNNCLRRQGTINTVNSIIRFTTRALFRITCSLYSKEGNCRCFMRCRSQVHGYGCRLR